MTRKSSKHLQFRFTIEFKVIEKMHDTEDHPNKPDIHLSQRFVVEKVEK